MGTAENIKRALVAFSVEVTCLTFAYLAYLFWKEGLADRIIID